MNFIKSATKPSEYIIDNIPEVCFIGRSNVGKSSLINALANSKISRTSSTPGRTQLINYFDYDKVRIVDLPGYGFARLSKVQQLDISRMIETYFHQSKNLKMILQICDANVVTDLDYEMCQYFKRLHVDHFILLNKADKMNIRKYEQQVKKISEFLLMNEDNILLVSAKQKINIKKIQNLIFSN